jgi:hypothetical protein
VILGEPKWLWFLPTEPGAKNAAGSKALTVAVSEVSDL